MCAGIGNAARLVSTDCRHWTWRDGPRYVLDQLRAPHWGGGGKGPGRELGRQIARRVSRIPDQLGSSAAGGCWIPVTATQRRLHARSLSHTHTLSRSRSLPAASSSSYSCSFSAATLVKRWLALTGIRLLPRGRASSLSAAPTSSPSLRTCHSPGTAGARGSGKPSRRSADNPRQKRWCRGRWCSAVAAARLVIGRAQLPLRWAR